MVEAAAYLLDVVHAEKDIERAVDVRIEFCGAIDRLVAQRKMERHQAVIAPVPGIELLAHVLREQVFAGHSHSGGRVDGTGNEAATFDRAAIREAYAGGAAVTHDDFLDVSPGDDRAAARFDHPCKRVRKTGGAADRQCELHDVGEDEREDNAGAGHAFGRYNVHVRGEQRADAVVFEMLAHHAEQVVLGVREELLGLRAREAILELVDRKRRVEGDRGEQRAHLHGIKEMQLTEGLGVARRESRERSAGLVEVLVDDDTGAVAERRALLDWRLDIREAETVEFQVADQGRMAQPHEEIGVQVEAIARQSRLFRRATATDAGVSFDDRDFQTGPSQIGRKRESVMPGSDDHTIELFHSLLPATASTLLHEPTLDHGVDAFVAVDELRHAQVAGHSDYFRKHLVLSAFGGREGVRPFGKIIAQFQHNKYLPVLYPQDHPQMSIGFQPGDPERQSTPVKGN